MGFLRLILGWVIGNRILLIGAGMVMLMVYAKGRMDGAVACVKADTTAIVKKDKEDAKIRTTVRKMAVPAVDHALLEWLRPDDQ